MNLRHVLPTALLSGTFLASLSAVTSAQAQNVRNTRTVTVQPVRTQVGLIANDTPTSTSAATNPVGFTTLTVNGQTNGSSGYNFLSLNMVRPALYRAVVLSAGSSVSNGRTVLSFPSGTFTNDQFDGSGNACYLELTNGQYAGLTANVVSTLATDASHNGASTVTLDIDLTTAITPGTTTFLIRPHWTFGSAFGPSNSTGLKGSYSASSADNIQIIDPNTGTGTNYYFDTTNSRWQYLGNDATNIVIPPGAGLNVLRKQATSTSITLVGEVKLGQTALPIVGGSTPSNTNLIPNPYPLASVTLANSNLYTGNATTGVVGSFSASTADNVTVLDSTTGSVANYYYDTINNRWQTLGNDASTFTIPSGASVLITRKNGRSSFIWYLPQPAMNL